MMYFVVTLLPVFGADGLAGVATNSRSIGATLARLMQAEQLSENRRRSLLDSLPGVVVDDHEFSSARRALTVPLGDSLRVHVLVAGSRLPAAASNIGKEEEAPLCRVLCGGVELVRCSPSTASNDQGSCACFGGDVCPRPNCRWRRPSNDNVPTDIDKKLDTSLVFEANKFEAVATCTSVVVDVGCRPRKVTGAIRLATVGPADLAAKLWPLGVQDEVLREREEWFEESAPKVEEEQPQQQQQKKLDLQRIDSRLGVAGMDDVLAMLDTRVRVPLAAPPELLRELGVAPIKGVVLYGAPGCGKSLLARRVAEALSEGGEPPAIVAAPELLDKYLGASEENIRHLFEGDGDDKKKDGLRCVVIDEIDAIATKRSDRGGASGGADRARDSIVNQLLSIMDGVDSGSRTLAVATTNRLDLLDPALLRPGRFEVHVKVDPPDENGRRQILRVHTETARKSGRLHLDAVEELDRIASDLPDGTTGATIAAIVRLAASFALKRYFDDENEDAIIFLDDMRQAAAQVVVTSPVAADEGEQQSQ